MNGYLFAAYLVIWTILFLYLLYLWRQQKQVSHKLDALQRQLERQPPE